MLDETLADILVIDEGFFGRVFRWDLTPEGREFWKDIDDKWWKKFPSRGRWGTSCGYAGLLLGFWFSGAGWPLVAAKRASATAGGIHKFSTLMTVVEDFFS